jgi:hypothetical protein
LVKFSSRYPMGDLFVSQSEYYHPLRLNRWMIKTDSGSCHQEAKRVN